MKFILEVIVLFCVLFVQGSLLASQKELRWGGPGYDPALKSNRQAASSRYVAQFSHDYKKGGADPSVIEIWVDSQETVDSVKRLDLVSVEGERVSSTNCWKAMRHISAPWACTFATDTLKGMDVQAIEAFDNQKRLSSGPVDPAFSQFVKDKHYELGGTR